MTITEHAPQRAEDDGCRGWLELRTWAESFHDIQQARIAITGRLRTMPEDLYTTQAEAIHTAERLTRLAMIRTYRRVAPPAVIDWQQRSAGIGEPLLARLLGHLGHPRIAQPYHWEGTGTARTLIADPPYERSVAQLWSYCGHGDPARRRRKGMTADEAAALGNPNLKSLVWNMAVAAMKQIERPRTDQDAPGTQSARVGVGEPLELAQCCRDPHTNSGGLDYRYRAIYDMRRFTTHDHTHNTDCVRCGPSGKPAPAGSPWSPAHQHADALRIVGKEILRDLWTLSQP